MQIAEWDERYRTGKRGTEQSPAPLIARFIPGLKPGRALDLACGTGRHSLLLAKLGWDVTAVDGSAEALAVLRQHANGAGVAVKTVLADLQRSDFVIDIEAFDLILVCYYLQRSLFPAIFAGTRRGGMVIAIVHIPEGDQLPNETRAAPGELRSLFAGWQILHDYEGPPNDPAHQRFVAEIVAMR
jgi:SAM-dependent methyltransferase